MSNLILNPTFDAGKTSWTGDLLWNSGLGYPYPGCGMLPGSSHYGSQVVTVATAGLYQLCIALQSSAVDETQGEVTIKVTQNALNLIDKTVFLPESGFWFPYVFDVNLGALSTTFRIDSVTDENHYFDSVGLFPLDGDTLAGLALEVQKRRGDMAGVLHPAIRYEEAINNALRHYPRRLWAPTVNSATLDTVSEQRVYALSGISAITGPEQVRRVWIDDDDGNPLEYGRWEVQDNAGALSLVFDEDPPAASRDIVLEYLSPPAQLSYPWETTDADREWLVAMALSLLYAEADSGMEEYQELALQREYWLRVLIERERALFGRTRRPSRRGRTTAWGNYI